MTSADVVLLGLIVLSGIIAGVRGLTREVMTILAWAGAAAAAIAFASELHPYVRPYVSSQDWVDPICYAVVFVVALIVLSVAGRLLGGFVRNSPVSGIDRTLGLAFGLARGAALVAAGYIVLSMSLPIDRWPEPLLQSRSLPLAYEGARIILPMIPGDYRPAIYGPPPSRQVAADDLLTATPSGRASDPPPRK